MECHMTPESVAGIGYRHGTEAQGGTVGLWFLGMGQRGCSSPPVARVALLAATCNGGLWHFSDTDTAQASPVQEITCSTVLGGRM